MHLKSVLRVAVAGPGNCHRQAQAGRTLLQNHPLMPAAPHSRWQCPALQLCPHTLWGGYSLEGLYGESSGQTHGERTKTQQYKKDRLSNCDHRHRLGSSTFHHGVGGKTTHSFKGLWQLIVAGGRGGFFSVIATSKCLCSCKWSFTHDLVSDPKIAKTYKKDCRRETT